ncbi:MAG: hypothetical protein A2297_04085 [Elusimicrobia bacterium RIFOXYB2_FULL_48_7]|nr:MAG: hypothetical protein A2297_04085 [Elusimicrobia bacterium RIFOXYB2_FULL_48_7]
MDQQELEQFREVFISEARENLNKLNSLMLELEKNPGSVEPLKDIFRVAHTIKGMAATMGYENITALTHEMENILDKLRCGSLNASPGLINTIFGCFDNIEVLVDEVATGENKNIDVGSLIEKLKNSALACAGSKAAAPEPPKPQEPTEAAAPETQPQDTRPGAPGHAAAQTVRLKVENLDRLMNLVGELVINKAQLVEISKTLGNYELAATLKQFNRVSAELQEEVLKTRMIPLKSIFDRYPRMLRDLSKRLDKEVNFDVIGSEIEIDRTLLEEINEPLVHLLRNAIDHGIETTQERIAKGKPAEGNITLTARREKGYCFIEIKDDGKGMDSGEVKAKAVEKGIISGEEAAKLSEKEAFNLICHPSFSTAKEVTDISGRGVGMDVVKNVIDSFNGKFEIMSKKGAGSVFVLQLPLTLAIIQAMLVRSGNEIYAIPLSNIEESYCLNSKEINKVGKKEVFLHRNEVIPLVRLDRLFGPDKAAAVPAAAGKTSPGCDYYTVIVEINANKTGILVDALMGKSEIVIKSLPGITRHAKNFSGATIMGNGKVVLIIDIASLEIL